MEEPLENSQEYKEMLDKIVEIAKPLAELQEYRYNLISSNIKYILNNNIKDEREIEQALEDIFEFCDDEDALQLFRKLCGHYYKINPVATAHHVQWYINEYDPKKEKFGKNKKV